MKDISEIAPGLMNASSIEGVVTAGQPEEQHFEQLAEAGFKTVVDIRTPEEPRDGFEESEVVRRAGMEYINVPVGHETVEDETLDRLRELLRDPNLRPMLLHCKSANRLGALLIAYFVLDEGKTPEEAVEIATQAGLKSDELKEAALKYVNKRQKR